MSAGIAAARWLEEVKRQPAAFEPAELREQVTSSWAWETEVHTEDEVGALIEHQLPFHFREPQGPALREYQRRTAGRARYAPEVIRHFAAQDYGGIDVEDRLGEVMHPVLVIAVPHTEIGQSQQHGRSPCRRLLLSREHPAGRHRAQHRPHPCIGSHQHG